MVLNIDNALEPQRLTKFFFKEPDEIFLGFEAIGSPNYLTALVVGKQHDT